MVKEMVETCEAPTRQAAEASVERLVGRLARDGRLRKNDVIVVEGPYRVRPDLWRGTVWLERAEL
jgi:hypothetical protein